MADISIRFKLRRGTAANLASVNETPLAGELVVETDTGKAKLGDGTTAWNSLPYWNAGGVASFNTRTGVVTLTSGDVTGALGFTPAQSGAITGSGLTMATSRLLGRTTASTGAVEEISAGTGISFSGGTINARGSVLNLYKGDAGTYLLNVLTAQTLLTSTPVANRLDFYPLIPLAEDVTLSALAIYVTTGVASTLARVGVYADNNGKPDGGALIADSGALDTATSATAREGAVSVTLSKGTRYWLALLTNGAPTLRGLSVASVLALPVMTDLSLTSTYTTRRVTQTYGALPATAPTGTTVTATVQVAIGLKIA